MRRDPVPPPRSDIRDRLARLDRVERQLRARTRRPPRIGSLAWLLVIVAVVLAWMVILR